MYTLLYENGESAGYSFIGYFESENDCIKEISRFWSELGYKIPYIRSYSVTDGKQKMKKLDIGFHTRFYYIMSN